MNRLQFIIVTSLSGVIALCIFVQIILVRMSATDELNVQKAQATLQQGQLCYTRLQQIAGRVAQLAQSQNDQVLKDLLTRQNITIKPPGSDGSAPAGASAPTITTPEPASTH
jgi:hypothetical protein